MSIGCTIFCAEAYTVLVKNNNTGKDVRFNEKGQLKSVITNGHSFRGDRYVKMVWFHI